MRLVVFDARGTGLSERPQHVTLEGRRDDIVAVLDAIGCQRASVLAISTSGNVCALFAATYPDRCERLVLERPAPGVFFCRFDGPARAIACAGRIVDGAHELGLRVRAGVHTGECELVGKKIAGIAVVTGARISALAAPGEVLVSSTVKDLVAGSGFSFEERGEHELKGVPGTWRLYAVGDG